MPNSINTQCYFVEGTRTEIKNTRAQNNQMIFTTLSKTDEAFQNLIGKNGDWETLQLTVQRNFKKQIVFTVYGNEEDDDVQTLAVTKESGDIYQAARYLLGEIKKCPIGPERTFTLVNGPAPSHSSSVPYQQPTFVQPFVKNYSTSSNSNSAAAPMPFTTPQFFAPSGPFINEQPNPQQNGSKPKEARTTATQTEALSDSEKELESHSILTPIEKEKQLNTHLSTHSNHSSNRKTSNNSKKTDNISPSNTANSLPTTPNPSAMTSPAHHKKPTTLPTPLTSTPSPEAKESHSITTPYSSADSNNSLRVLRTKTKQRSTSAKKHQNSPPSDRQPTSAELDQHLLDYIRKERENALKREREQWDKAFGDVLEDWEKDWNPGISNDGDDSDMERLGRAFLEKKPTNQSQTPAAQTKTVKSDTAVQNSKLSEPAPWSNTDVEGRKQRADAALAQIKADMAAVPQHAKATLNAQQGPTKPNSSLDTELFDPNEE